MPQPILRQSEQYAYRVARGLNEQYQNSGHSGVGNLEQGEFMWNTDPELGTTHPGTVGPAPEGAVTDARVMHPHETGLEYPVLARPSKDHPNSFDVIKPLG